MILGKFASIQTSLGNFALAQILEGRLIIAKWIFLSSYAFNLVSFSRFWLVIMLVNLNCVLQLLIEKNINKLVRFLDNIINNKLESYQKKDICIGLCLKCKFIFNLLNSTTCQLKVLFLKINLLIRVFNLLVDANTNISGSSVPQNISIAYIDF